MRRKEYCSTRPKGVRDELKIDNLFVDRIGMAAGLALLWDSEWYVKLKTLSKSHIDVIVTKKDGV